MAEADPRFRWSLYLLVAVAVYVLSALFGAFAIGAASFVRDPSYHANPLAILGLGLLAAVPLLALGIPIAVGLSVLIRFLAHNRTVTRPVVVLMSIGAGVLLLLTFVKFDVEGLAPESLAYVLPWLLFGMLFRLRAAQAPS